jgi:hypothetical protein
MDFSLTSNQIGETMLNMVIRYFLLVFMIGCVGFPIGIPSSDVDDSGDTGLVTHELGSLTVNCTVLGEDVADLPLIIDDELSAYKSGDPFPIDVGKHSVACGTSPPNTEDGLPILVYNGLKWAAPETLVDVTADGQTVVSISQNRNINDTYSCWNELYQLDMNNSDFLGDYISGPSFDAPQKISLIEGQYLEGSSDNGFASSAHDSDVWTVDGKNVKYSSSDEDLTVRDAEIYDDDSFGFTLTSDLHQVAVVAVCEVF